MRLSLKLLVMISIVALLLFVLPQNYTDKSRGVAVGLDSYLECFGLNSNRLINESEKFYKNRGSQYLLISRGYEVPPDFPFDSFQKELKIILKKRHLNFLKRDGALNDVEYSITFRNNPIYKILFSKKEKGYLAIVLDDFGYSNKRFYYFKKIDMPLNISILPDLKYSKSASALASASGHEVLLHLPMEPVKSKKIERHLEKCTIKNTTSDKEIIEEISAFLDTLGNIKGVNNHMGSSLCRNREKMITILSTLKKHGIYFLDSRVIPDSKGPEIAAELGLKCFQRDVFIDNINDKDYIKNQIRAAIYLAKKRGFAIAIGHDRDKTLETILNMSDEIKDNAYLIRLSELK